MSEQEAVTLLLSLGYTISKPQQTYGGYMPLWNPTNTPDCRFCFKKGGHPYGEPCPGLTGTSVVTRTDSGKVLSD